MNINNSVSTIYQRQKPIEIFNVRKCVYISGEETGFFKRQ